jgi:hypothetical protein
MFQSRLAAEPSNLYPRDKVGVDQLRQARALRAVLPLARLIRASRRLTGTAGARLAPLPSSQKRAASASNVLRGIAWLLYRVIRPVVRPVAWRTREFFLEPLRPMVAQSEAITRQVDAITRDVGAVRHALATAQLDGSLSAELVKSIETLLMTVALSAPRMQ